MAKVRTTLTIDEDVLKWVKIRAARTGVSDSAVRVNDPWPGTQYWIAKSTFERSWHDFYNMAIIY